MVRAAADRLVTQLASNTGSGGTNSSNGSVNADELKQAGSEHFKEGRLTIAGSLYRSAIQARPDFAEAHNNLGAVLRRREKPQSAIAAFQTALMLNPRSSFTYANLANLHERYGNIAQAEAFYLRAVELDPHLYQAFIGLARIASLRERWDEALSALTRAGTIVPQSPEILYQVGIVNLYKGNLSEALNNLRNAEVRAPKNANVKASLAEVYIRLDRREDAEESLSACFNLDPENALGLSVRKKMEETENSSAQAEPNTD